MSQRNQTARFQIIAFFIVAPLLIVAMAWALKPLNSHSMLKESFWAHKVSAEPVYDVVVVGDSRVYRGVYPEYIEKTYQQLKGQSIRVFNYGFSSAGVEPFILGKAKHLLKPAGKRILVIALSPNSFIESSQANGHLREIEAQGEKDLWVKKHIYPSLRFFNRYTLSDFIKARKGEFYYEDYHLNSGFTGSSKAPYDSGAAHYQYQRQLSSNAIDSHAVQLFLKTIQELRAEGIQVYVIRIPTTQRMRVLEDQLTHDFTAHLLTDVKQLEFPILQPDLKGIHSYDGSHLDSSSAKLLSIRMANLLFK